jgi:hypothetical protein
MKKYLLGFLTFAAAFVILSVSVKASSSVSYVFATPVPFNILGAKMPEIDYTIPYAGRIGPDNMFWSFKVVRDRIWYLFTSGYLKKAELALLFSDKRLAASKKLFEDKKPDIALSTLSKGEKYLEIVAKEEELARKGGVDTSIFLSKMATASLKHRQLIEEILPLAPEDAKPEIVKIEDYSKNTFKYSRDALNSKGMLVPNNPFTGQD